MRCIFFFLAIFPWLLQAQEDPVFLNEPNVAVIKRTAEAGDSNCQLIMGIILEIGYGLPQNIEEAVGWYWLSAQQGNPRAQKRLGVLICEGEAVPQDKVYGMALILEGSFASDAYWKEFEAARIRVSVNLTEDEIEEAFHLAMSWRARKRGTANARMIGNPIIRLVSDRTDPQDANERVYGPGTWDGNRGILRSEYERQQRELEEFASKIEDLKVEAELKKWDSVREKIQALEKKSGRLRLDALIDLGEAVLAAMGAGSTLLSCPPATLIQGFLAVELFKGSAEKYHEAIDIQNEIQRFLDLERTLDRDRERYGSGRER